MTDANSLREQAKRCRNLSKTVIEPEVIEQLHIWEVELPEEADQAEWRAAEEVHTLTNPRMFLHEAPVRVVTCA
jgi:hypothetical protein